MKSSLLSATSLASVTFTPSLAARPSSVVFVAPRQAARASAAGGVVAVSLATVLAASVAPADASVIYTFNGATTASTVTFGIGTSASGATPGYTLVGSSSGTTLTLARTAGLATSSTTTTITFPAPTLATAGATFTVNSISTTTLSDANPTRTRTFTFTPTTTGAQSASTVFRGTNNTAATGYKAKSNDDTSVTISGIGVAPLASVASAVTINARAGSGVAGTGAITVQNTGTGNLAGKTSAFNLTGSVASSAGTFAGAGGTLNGSTGLNDSNFGAGATTSASFTFNYTPSASRGSSSTTITTTLGNGLNSSNSKGTATTTVTGVSVGPVYDAAVTGSNPNSGPIINGGTIQFGSLVGGLTNQHLLISNLSNDSATKALTDLNLTSITISNAAEFSFSLTGFNSNTASSGSISNTKNAGIAGDISIQFQTLTSKTGSAQLTIQTDEGASQNGSGNIYVYNLLWTNVPEPGTMMVFGVGMLGLAISRRNRSGKAEAVSLTAKGANDIKI